MEEELKYIFDNVNKWLHYAEAKNAILLTLQGATIAAILQTLSGDKLNSDIYLYHINVYLISVTIPFLIIGMVIMLWSFIPVTNNNLITTLDTLILNVISDDDNLLLYTHIAKYKTDEYLHALERIYNLKVNNMNYALQLANQIIVNSRITCNKFNYFKRSIRFSLYAIIPFLLIIDLVLFFIREVRCLRRSGISNGRAL